jgi:5-methylcytosine-specific restriction protein B
MTAGLTRLQWSCRSAAVGECGVDPALVADIERRMVELNEQIATDLGSPFRIGHSYVTPSYRLESGDTKKWFRQVVETEIGPLLEEYWFDSPKRAKETRDRLIEGW